MESTTQTLQPLYEDKNQSINQTKQIVTSAYQAEQPRIIEKTVNISESKILEGIYFYYS